MPYTFLTIPVRGKKRETHVDLLVRYKTDTDSNMVLAKTYLDGRSEHEDKLADFHNWIVDGTEGYVCIGKNRYIVPKEILPLIYLTWK